MDGCVSPLSLQEFRSLFISILRSAYENQIRDGELDDHEFLTIALDASLDFADDAVSRGEPLSDWEYLYVTFDQFSLVSYNDTGPDLYLTTVRNRRASCTQSCCFCEPQSMCLGADATTAAQKVLL